MALHHSKANKIAQLRAEDLKEQMDPESHTSSATIEKAYTSVSLVNFTCSSDAVGKSSGARYLAAPANLVAVKPAIPINFD
jgi:hypothetical protein